MERMDEKPRDSLGVNVKGGWEDGSAVGAAEDEAHQRVAALHTRLAKNKAERESLLEELGALHSLHVELSKQAGELLEKFRI